MVPQQASAPTSSRSSETQHRAGRRALLWASLAASQLRSPAPAPQAMAVGAPGRQVSSLQKQRCLQSAASRAQLFLRERDLGRDHTSFI